MSEKITVYPIRQAFWGCVPCEIYYFRSKEERDYYYSTHDHLDKLRARRVDPCSVDFYYNEEQNEDGSFTEADWIQYMRW